MKAILILGIILFLMGCSQYSNNIDGSSETTIVSSSEAGVHEVLISSERIDPEVLTISVGDSVIFKSENEMELIGTDEIGSVYNGKAIVAKFNEAGVFEYHETISDRDGAIIVE